MAPTTLEEKTEKNSTIVATQSVYYGFIHSLMDGRHYSGVPERDMREGAPPETSVPGPRPMRPPASQPYHQFRPTMPRPMHTGASSSPKDWPPAVREYVERCFKSAKPSQRQNLQHTLRLIIHDAQVNGQLYSRPWSSLPPPDLSLTPEQAASVVINAARSRGSRFDVGPAVAWRHGGVDGRVDGGFGVGGAGAGGARDGAHGLPAHGLPAHGLPAHGLPAHGLPARGSWPGLRPPPSSRSPPVAYTVVNPQPVEKPSMVSSSKKRPISAVYQLEQPNQQQEHTFLPPIPSHPSHHQQERPQPTARNLRMPQKMPKRKQKKTNSSSNTYTHSQGGNYAEDEHARRIERAGRFRDDGALAVGANINFVGQKIEKKNHNHRRKVLNQISKQGDPLSIDWDRFAISGTCESLEKAYFRLTSAPDPSTVRPAPVLRKALSRLVDLIASGDVNYFYSQDQFKGMRQDCVVQALKGDLPIAIYEAHARAALEYGDMAEYNQCQSQLRGLYSTKTRKAEFIAYRILYQSIFSFLNRNRGEIVVGLLESLDDAEGVSSNANVSHALEVRKALVSSNYAAFFRLYETAPALGRALMDLAVPKLRFACLEAFMKAFKMRLEVGDFLCSVLGFLSRGQMADGNAGDVKIEASAQDNENKPLRFYEPGCSKYSTGEFEGKHRGVRDTRDAMEECMEWLEDCGVAFFASSDDGEPPVVDCKLSLQGLRMPEEKDAVAHGDANLEISDFFKSMQGPTVGRQDPAW